MQKSILYTSISGQTTLEGVHPMNQNVHPTIASQIDAAQTINTGMQQPTQPAQQFTSAANQFQQQQAAAAGNTANAANTANSTATNSTSAASNSAQPNGSSAQGSNVSTNANTSEEMVIPSLLAPNGSLDWDAVVHWGIYKYSLDPTDRTRIKRPVIPLAEQAQKHLLPSPLSLELHKLVKQVYDITNRSKQNAAHKTCLDVILRHALAMVDLAVVVEKRSGNNQPLYALDEVHEMARRIWLSLYEFGFFGDSRGGRKYNEYKGIHDFARINKSMDTIGRIIGSLKKKRSASIDNKKGNMVNSRSFHK